MTNVLTIGMYVLTLICLAITRDTSVLIASGLYAIAIMLNGYRVIKH